MAARVSNRVIAERIDELETFIEDSLTEAVSANASWKDPLTLTLALGDGEDEYSVDQIREAARNCYEAYHANALIRRAVNVKSHFVWGRGVTITSDQVEVNAVLTDWLERNQGELGHLGRVEKEIQAQIGGNLFLLCQVDDLGAVEVVTVPISEIAGYLRDPKNPRKVWYWKRTFTEYTVQKDGTSTGKSQTYWYPALGHNPEKQPKTIGGTPVVWTDRLHHAPLPRAGKGVYGLPAIVAGIPWGKAYTQHLSNVASINAALATFAWKATGANPAAARAVADVVDRQKRTPIPTGSTLASTPGVTMEPIRTAGVATSADEARRFALMVCSDTDVPEHILLGDPSTGNLATTKTMERPLELAVLDRQAWWVDTLTLLGSFAVEARVLAQGFAPLTGKVEIDDWGRRQVLVSVRRVVKDHETDREVTEARAAKAAPGTKATKKEAADANLGPVQEEVAEVTVEFPAILEHDPVSEVAAIISAATAGTGSLAGIMDRATFQRLLLRAINIPNVDDAIAEMDDEDIARQVERHENPPELELARQAQAAKLGGEEPDEDEDAPPAKKGVKKPTKRSRDKDVEEGIEESLSAVATALQEVARTALVETGGPVQEDHWVTLKDGRHVLIKGEAPPMPADTPDGPVEEKVPLEPGDPGYLPVDEWRREEDSDLRGYLRTNGDDPGEPWTPYRYDKTLSLEERDMVNTYTTEAHNDINNYWREVAKGNPEPGEPYVVGLTPGLDAAIDKGRVIEGHRIYRGVGDGTGAKLFNARVGDTYTDAGFQSWSLSVRTSKDFCSRVAGNAGYRVMLRAITRAGEPARYVDDQEFEIIYPRNKKWKIVRRSVVGKGMMGLKTLVVDVIQVED